MTNEEAIKYLIRPIQTSTELKGECARQFDAYLMAVDALRAEGDKQGEWLDLDEGFKRRWFRHHMYKCSRCGNTLDMDGVNAGRGDANYCPNCGAKMRKEE